jgi:hypothetical protein
VASTADASPVKKEDISIEFSRVSQFVSLTGPKNLSRMGTLTARDSRKSTSEGGAKEPVAKP